MLCVSVVYICWPLSMNRNHVKLQQELLMKDGMTCHSLK